MRVPFSYLTEQFANPEPIFEKIRAFLKRCDFTLGEDLTEFEKKFAAYGQSKHAIGVGTGTDALFLSLKACGIENGDEVITPPNSFIATTGAIIQTGARPVYVDIADDMNIDINLIESAITERTRAILPVHWAGCPAKMEAICQLAKDHHLAVVEDGCQAMGARINGKAVGTFGACAAFSFHPLKPLHVWGDAGMILTNDDILSEKLRLYRNHGMKDRDTIVEYGVNSRFDNLHAIVALHEFETMDSTIEKRIQWAKYYDNALSGIESIQIPKRAPNDRHVYHLYIIQGERRDELLKYLNHHGIEAKVHYPIPLHLQPAAKRFNYKQGQFPKTEAQSQHSITLPAHQYLKEEQISFVVDKVKKFYA